MEDTRTFVRDQKTVDALLAELESGSENGQLTPDQLLQIMLCIDNTPHQISNSIGAEWIFENPDKFQKCVGDVLKFMKERCWNTVRFHFFQGVLYQENFLRQIPEAERVQFLHDVYVKFGAYYDFRWIEIVQKLGLTRADCAKMFLDYVRGLPDRYGHELLANEASTFVEHYGRPRLVRYPQEDPKNWELSPDDPWNLFDVDEFYQLMLVLAQKVPNEVVRNWVKIADWKLGQDKIVPILCHAVKYLKDPTDMSLDTFRVLPMAVRQSICWSLEVNLLNRTKVAQFLVDTLLKTPHCVSFVDTTSPVIDKIPAGILLRETLRLSKELRQGLPSEFMAGYVYRKCQEEDVWVADVEVGQYTPRGEARPRCQFQVRAGRRLFVQDRFQHRYSPSEGDIVIVSGKGARPLARRDGYEVFSATFVPVYKDE